jgi:hypothetical protein
MLQKGHFAVKFYFATTVAATDIAAMAVAKLSDCILSR